MIGRIEKHTVVGYGLEDRRRCLDVTANDTKPLIEPIGLRILAREIRQVRLDLEPGHCHAFSALTPQAVEKTQGRGADATAQLDQPLTGARRYGGGKKDRIDGRTVASGRLTQPYPAAEQGIDLP